ncbi:hypothetical protein [Endozoicomonas acroporae]
MSSNIEAHFSKYIEEHPDDPESADEEPAFAETIEKKRGRQEQRQRTLRQ